MSDDGLLSLLDALLRGHGLVTALSGHTVRVPSLGQDWQAEIVGEFSHSVQLDVRIQLWPGRWLVESVAGVGTGQAARRDALTAFVNGSFHAILAVFGVPQDDRVERTTWTIGGVARDVVIGPCTLRGRAANPTAWVPAFQRFVEASGLSGGVHWIRVFCAASDGNRIVLEVLRDNAPWLEATAALADADWPTGDGYVSVRLFAIVRGGVDVTQAAALIAEHGDEAALVALGDSAEARRAIAFVPLAFGRVLLDPLGCTFAQIAILRDDRGDNEHSLEDDPLWCTAVEHARDVRARGPSTLFRTLASRSPEVDAVNEALNAGAQAADLVLSAPVVALTKG